MTAMVVRISFLSFATISRAAEQRITHRFATAQVCTDAVPRGSYDHEQRKQYGGKAFEHGELTGTKIKRYVERFGYRDQSGCPELWIRRLVRWLPLCNPSLQGL